MSIIAQVGRRDAKTRALYACIILVLVVGSVATIYPFLLMIAGSTKSAVDQKDMTIVPRFLVSDEALYRKHIEGLFNESLDAMNAAYDADVTSFELLTPPADTNRKLAETWNEFLSVKNLPGYTYACGYVETPVSRTLPKTLREFKAHLARKYGGTIEQVNRAVGSEFVNWNAFSLVPDRYMDRAVMPSDAPLTREFWQYKAGEPPGNRFYFCIEGFFKKLYLKSQYTKDIEKYNAAHGTRYSSYSEIHLSRAVPDGAAKEREDWEQFVRLTLNPLWIRLRSDALPLYRSYLEARYGGIAALNKAYAANYGKFDDVPPIEEVPFEGIALSDWVAFITGWKDPDTGRLYMAPADTLLVHSPDFMFRDFLKAKFDTIENLNAQLGASFHSFMDILPPQKEAHYLYSLESRKELRSEFAWRNFRAVIDYMVLHGRGIINTVIYCGLTVLFALLVNPMAAYALSRFKLPASYKILLFLMITMAFPPIVTQIPVFLMMKKLNLLNTFAALVLPGLANGYAIFLLKGFFDSLPRELYESASLDGAGEWTMFWTITMSMSKPVLAVISLQAFTLAYGNFMFALLVCQDEKMWTLMVWLYQLQQKSGEGVIYASLLVAAVPTLLIFVLCQKIIMRGIVIPCER